MSNLGNQIANARIKKIRTFSNKVFWAHSFWQGKESKVLRVRLLPSNRLRKAAADAHMRVSGILEYEISQNRIDEQLNKLYNQNEKGWNCYFFPGVVDAGFSGYAKDSDIRACPYLFLDLDVQLPITIEEFRDELGIWPAAAWSTSSRDGWPKHQMLFAITQKDCGDIEKWKETARELVLATGADVKAKNPARILRIPETINWKDSGRSDCIVSGGELLLTGSEEYTLDECRECLERFKSRELSKELCNRRALSTLVDAKTDKLHGGNKEGYIDWQEALEKAGAGEKTVGSGARHNHLIFWEAQQLASGVGYEESLKNLEQLNNKALEEPIRGKEWEDILRYCVELGAKQEQEEFEKDRQLEKLLDEDTTDAAELEAGVEAGAGAEVTIEEVKKQAGIVFPRSAVQIPRMESQGNRSADAPAAESPDRDKNQSAAAMDKDNGVSDKPPAPATGSADNPEGAGVSIAHYARRLVHQGKDQTPDQWWQWLVVCAKRLRFCKDKSDASFGPFAEHIYARFKKLGLCYGRYGAIPKCILCADGRRYWVLCELSADDAKTFFTHYLWGLQSCIRKRKKELVEALKTQGINLGLRGLRFACSRAFVSEAVEALLAYGIDNEVPGSKSRETRIIFQNGVLNLGPGPTRGFKENWDICREHPAAITCRYLVGENGNLETPQFDGFLEEAFPGDGDGKKLIWRMIGYCLLPSNPLQKMFYLEGVTAGGKGILSEIILHLVGDNAAGVAQFKRLSNDAGLGPYVGKSVLFIDEAEAESDREYSEVMAVLKRAAGGNLVPVRRMYEDEWNVRMGTKFLLASNKMVDFEDIGGGMARRLIPIHFSHSKERLAVEPISLKIAREEGDKIATKGSLALAAAWDLGPSMFSIETGSGIENAVNLSMGKANLATSTDQIAEMLNSVLVRTHKATAPIIPLSLLTTIGKVAIHRKKIKYMAEKSLTMAIGLECERIGFARVADVRFGGLGHGRGISMAEFNVKGMLNWLELSQEEFEELLGKNSTDLVRQYAGVYLDLNIARMSMFSQFQSAHGFDVVTDKKDEFNLDL